MKISKVDLIGAIASLRRIKIEKTDKFFFWYSVFSIAFRIFLNYELLKHFNLIVTVGIAFLCSVIITFLAVKISDYKKLDWYGKEKENVVFLLINFFFKGVSKKTLFSILFVFDSFLLFVYSGNCGNRNIKTGILLLLSLLFISMFWGTLGYLINWKFIAIGVVLLFFIIRKATKVLIRS